MSSPNFPGFSSLEIVSASGPQNNLILDCSMRYSRVCLYPLDLRIIEMAEPAESTLFKSYDRKRGWTNCGAQTLPVRKCRRVRVLGFIARAAPGVRFAPWKPRGCAPCCYRRRRMRMSIFSGKISPNFWNSMHRARSWPCYDPSELFIVCFCHNTIRQVALSRVLLDKNTTRQTRH